MKKYKKQRTFNEVVLLLWLRFEPEPKRVQEETISCLKKIMQQFFSVSYCFGFSALSQVPSKKKGTISRF